MNDGKKMSDFWKITYSFVLTSIIGTAMLTAVQNVNQRNELERNRREFNERIFVEYIVPFFGLFDRRLNRIRALADEYRYGLSSQDRDRAWENYDEAKDIWIENNTKYVTLIAMYFGTEYQKWIGDPYRRQTVSFESKYRSVDPVSPVDTFITMFFDLEQSLESVEANRVDNGRITAEEYNSLLDKIALIRDTILLFSIEIRLRLENNERYFVIVSDN